ncbi:MAG: DNA repair protein RadC, partial [Victivallales bacterium]|nr:DNA repair protein RadC [Victivallales bacterium]
MLYIRIQNLTGLFNEEPMHKEMLAGHRTRLRKKFISGGLKALHDYEALEMLLTFVIPRRDVKPLAKSLLLRFGDLHSVFEASTQDLQAVKGIGENAAVLLVFLRELCTGYLESKAFAADYVNAPKSVIDYVRLKVGRENNEFFMVLYLNTKNHILGYDCQEGTINRAAVYPRNILRRCMDLHATGVILVHNHPSGECDPSPA